MTVFALMMVAALGASEPDGVVATAPATTVDLSATAAPAAPPAGGVGQNVGPHDLTTDEQIDRWLAARSTAERPWADPTVEWVDDRKAHGEVSVGVGTGGYRDYGVAVSLPVGDHGRLDLSYRQVENGFGYGGYGYGGYGFGRGYDPLYSNDSGRLFPGYQPEGAGAAYESRVTRPNSSPQGFR